MGKTNFAQSIMVSLIILIANSSMFGQNIEEKYVPGEILVMFKPDIIKLPAGVTKARPSQITTNSDTLRVFWDLYNVSMIEKVLPDFTPNDTLAVSRTGEIVKLVDMSNYFLLKLPKGLDIKGVLSKFKALEEVIIAEPNYVLTAQERIPDDPTLTWGFYQPNDKDIDATEAWEITTGDPNVIMGIIDSGVNYYHEDLGEGIGTGKKVMGGYDFVDEDEDPMDIEHHGTQVAGIAGALTNNGKGVAGVAGGWWTEGNKGCSIMALRAGDINERGDLGYAVADVIQAINYARQNGVDVINMSFGGTTYHQGLEFALHNYFVQGGISVAGMGNAYDMWNYSDIDDIVYPAAFTDMVIAVGAVDGGYLRPVLPPLRNYDWESIFGDHIDVVGPCNGIVSTSSPGVNSYLAITGTSCATPFVTGAVGLILSVHPLSDDFTNEDIEGIMRASATDITTDARGGSGLNGWDKYTGTGIINTKRALDFLSSPWALTHEIKVGGSIYSSSGTILFYLNDWPYLAKRHEIRTTVNYSLNYASQPYIWARSLQSSGWEDKDVNYGWTFCEVVHGSETPTGATLYTYVYQLWTLDGETYLGWYPSHPSQVTFAYSVLGDMTPTTPQNLTASNADNGIMLNWSTCERADGYYVYRSTASGFTPSPSNRIATVSTNQHLDYNVYMNHTYYYKVQAYNAYAESGYSNEASVTTPGPLTVSMDGPDYLPPFTDGTYTAYASGGSGDYDYTWYKDGGWAASGNPATINSGKYSFTLEVQVDDNTSIAYGSATKYVEVGFAKPLVGLPIEPPKEFNLGQNYPNPFNPTTEIKYQVPKLSHVSLKIYNLMGQEIRTLVEGEKATGYYTALWDAKDNSGNRVASGVYIYRMVAGDYNQIRKMILIR